MTILYLVWREYEDEGGEPAKDTDVSTRPTPRAKPLAWPRSTITPTATVWEWSWPVTYRVRDVGTRGIWAVVVERQSVPEFVVEQFDPPPEPGLVHVLLHGQALCSHAWLRDVPAKWPKGQLWIGEPEITRDGASALNKINCVSCNRRARLRLDAIQLISDRKERT